jgi:hypothetical protein
MIQTWFLVVSLFFPRIAILVAYIVSQLPVWPAANFWVKFLMAGIIPRILILIYIATIMGICPWFWIHLVVAVLVYWGGASRHSSRD